MSNNNNQNPDGTALQFTTIYEAKKQIVSLTNLCQSNFMEKPKCKICGDRHYGLCKITDRSMPIQRSGEGYGFLRPQKNERTEVANSGIAAQQRANDSCPQVSSKKWFNSSGGNNELHNAGKPIVSDDIKEKFDRVAYQKEYMREYMRKRRAKAKNASS